MKITNSLKKKLKRIVNVIVTVITVLMITYSCCVSSFAVSSTLTSFAGKNPILKFSCSDYGYASDGKEYNSMYLVFPKEYKIISYDDSQTGCYPTSKTYNNIDYHVTYGLTITVRDVYDTNNNQLHNKWLMAHLSGFVSNQNTSYCRRIRLYGYLYNGANCINSEMPINYGFGSDYIDCTTGNLRISGSRSLVNYPVYVPYNSYSVLHYSSPNTMFSFWIPLMPKYVYDSLFNKIESYGGFEFEVPYELTIDDSVDEEECECHCQNCCDCNCGYYTEELKEELIDYFNTNMVTREMFEEFVEEQYGSAENFNNDYSELSSLQDDTSYQSQQDANQSKQDEMFSELGSYVDRLDEFESQLTVSPEVSQSALIFNSLFEHFPPAIIVALVFVLVMIVVVKILGR